MIMVIRTRMVIHMDIPTNTVMALIPTITLASLAWVLAAGVVGAGGGMTAGGAAAGAVGAEACMPVALGMAVLRTAVAAVAVDMAAAVAATAAEGERKCTCRPSVSEPLSNQGAFASLCGETSAL
jgi:hypothetical protein